VNLATASWSYVGQDLSLIATLQDEEKWSRLLNAAGIKLTE
jgi:hypothetical protein